MTTRRLALASVTNKTGLVKIGQCLARHGVEILSSTGTMTALKDSGVPVQEVSEYTDFPEMFDGRLKTIHPKIAGGMLFKRKNEEHVEQASTYEIHPIDFVIVNLYEFSKTIAKPEVTLEDAIEQIDIGGPQALRGAAKNFESVTVICDPADYDEVIQEMDANNGQTTRELRFHLACKVFMMTGLYDMNILAYLAGQPNSGLNTIKVLAELVTRLPF